MGRVVWEWEGFVMIMREQGKGNERGIRECEKEITYV